MAVIKHHLSKHLDKLNNDATFGARPTATTKKKRKRTEDGYEDGDEEDNRHRIRINDR